MIPRDDARDLGLKTTCHSAGFSLLGEAIYRSGGKPVADDFNIIPVIIPN